MPKYLTYEEHEILAAGGTFNLDPNDEQTDVHRFFSAAGPVTLVGSVSVTNGSSTPPVEGVTFTCVYEANLDLNGNTLTFFGTTMPTALEGKQFTVVARYDGAAFVVQYFVDFEDSGIVATEDLADNAVTFVKMQDFTGQGYILRGGAAGAPEELDASTSGQLLIGDGIDIDSVAMSGHVAIDGTGSTTIQAGVVTNAMMVANTLTAASMAANTITPNEVDATVKTELLTRTLSFEASEQGNMRIEVPFDGDVTKVTVYVDTAIAATDNGTVDCLDNAGVSMGVVTVTASAAIGTAFTISPSSNNNFVDGDVMTLVTNKVTAGGTMTASIKFAKT